jgi:hypothetical protein
MMYEWIYNSTITDLGTKWSRTVNIHSSLLNFEENAPGTSV